MHRPPYRYHQHRLVEADPTTALRLTGVLVRLLSPTDARSTPVMSELWNTINRFLYLNAKTDAQRASQREVSRC